MSDGKLRVSGSDALERDAQLEVGADDKGRLVIVAPAPGTFFCAPAQLPWLHHVLDVAGEEAKQQRPGP